MPVLYTKDPADVVDYWLDWSGWLPAGDTIDLSTVESLDPELIVQSSTHDPTSVTIWLSGGTLGKTYEVINRITTLAGRVAERSIFVHIRSLMFQ